VKSVFWRQIRPPDWNFFFKKRLLLYIINYLLFILNIKFVMQRYEKFFSNKKMQKAEKFFQLFFENPTSFFVEWFRNDARRRIFSHSLKVTNSCKNISNINGSISLRCLLYH
jgi:hypothetical protein